MSKFFFNLTGLLSVTLVLLSLFFIGMYTGLLWTWACGVTGIVYLLSLSGGLTTGEFAIIGQLLDSALSVLSPEPAGPLTSLIRTQFGTQLSGLCQNYIDTVEEAFFLSGDGIYTTKELILMFLWVAAVSIVIAILAGLYCNAELALVLFAVNLLFRIVRGQLKKRKAKKVQAAGQNGSADQAAATREQAGSADPAAESGRGTVKCSQD